MNNDNYKDRIVNEFLNLVKINSPSLKEDTIFEYLINRLKQFPVEIIFEKYFNENFKIHSGNLIVKLPANCENKKSIFFDAHVDTVEPTENIKPIIEDNIIKTDGTTILGSDDKAAIAAMIITIEDIINENKKHGDLYFLFTSAEEIGLVGVRYLDVSKIKADYGFILDAHGPVGGVIIGSPYHYNYTIKIKGKASHAGIEPEKGINAIKIAGKIINSLPQGRINKNTVANIGTINGGKANNITAEDCVINGEFRSHSISDIEKIKNKISNIVNKNKPNSINIELEITQIYKGFAFNKNEYIINLVCKALRALGIMPRFEISGGGSNTNIYNENGIKSLTLSIGMMNVHSNEEFIEIKELVNITNLIKKIIELS